jgi:uncharacterized membrane protein YqjE
MNDQERTMLPSAILGLAMTSGLTVAAFGLITVLIIVFAGDSPFRYILAAGTAIPVLAALPGLLLVIRSIAYFWMRRRTGE